MLREFVLSNYVVELRYSNAYLLWDRSGMIASLLKGRLQGVKLMTGEPGRIAFESEEKYRIDVRLDRANIAVFDDTLFSEKAVADVDHLLNGILNILEVELITRVGTRLDLRKKIADANSHAKEMMKYSFIRPITTEVFGIKPKSFVPNILFKMEDDDLGYRFHLHPVEQKFNVDVPLGIPAENSEEIQNYLKLDIDYYTLNPVSAMSYKSDIWMEKLAHAIRRDLDKVFVGLELPA